MQAGRMSTVSLHSNKRLLANGECPLQHFSIQRSPPRLSVQPGRGHAQCRVRAVVKTPSTEEPLRAPGSESSFTGSPANKRDIPITSPTSSSKHMQVNRVFQSVVHRYLSHCTRKSKLLASDPVWSQHQVVNSVLKQTSACMQEHLDLVRTDFQFVFKDILNLDHFEKNMFFSDPISKFTFFRGKCWCR